MSGCGVVGAFLAAAVIATGCGEDQQPAVPATIATGAASEAAPATVSEAETGASTGTGKSQAERPARLRRAACPPELSNCEVASGEIIYVERIDPDGDGDAHFVLISRESITAPGLSVVDVRADLRPRPLPGPGDRISAAGPVYEGSHGQLQIEAIEFHLAAGNGA